MGSSLRQLLLFIIVIGGSNIFKPRSIFISGVSINYNFISKRQAYQLVLCTCAKCGSTSLLTALCRSFRGSHNDSRCEGNSVYYTKLWGSNEQKNRFRRFFAIKPNSLAVYMWSYRDPVERYISAYKSKLQCCNSISRVPCIPRQNYYFAQNLITMTRGYKRHVLRPGANASNISCLFMEEYVRALEVHHFRKEQNKLEQHFFPQHLECPLPKTNGNIKATIYSGNISHIATKLRQIDASNYGFKINFTVPHINKKLDYTANFTVDLNIFNRLCWISLEEYKHMIDINIPFFCDFKRIDINNMHFNLTFEL